MRNLKSRLGAGQRGLAPRQRAVGAQRTGSPPRRAHAVVGERLLRPLGVRSSSVLAFVSCVLCCFSLCCMSLALADLTCLKCVCLCARVRVCVCVRAFPAASPCAAVATTLTSATAVVSSTGDPVTSRTCGKPSTWSAGTRPPSKSTSPLGTDAGGVAAPVARGVSHQVRALFAARCWHTPARRPSRTSMCSPRGAFFDIAARHGHPWRCRAPRGRRRQDGSVNADAGAEKRTRYPDGVTPWKAVPVVFETFGRSGRAALVHLKRRAPSWRRSAATRCGVSTTSCSGGARV